MSRSFFPDAIVLGADGAAVVVVAGQRDSKRDDGVPATAGRVANRSAEVVSSQGANGEVIVPRVPDRLHHFEMADADVVDVERLHVE